MMLRSLAPHAWARETGAPTELTLKLCLVANVNLPESLQIKALHSRLLQLLQLCGYVFSRKNPFKFSSSVCAPLIRTFSLSDV